MTKKYQFLFIILIAIQFVNKIGYSNDELVQVWGYQFGSSNSDVGRDVVGDNLGNCYIVGDTKAKIGDNHFGRRDVYVAKFDSSGKIVWINQFGSNQDDLCISCGYCVCHHTS